MAMTRKRGESISWIDSGTGTPILFLHAFPLDASMWAPQAVSGIRLIAADARGFGQSAEAPDRVDIDLIADDAAALLSSLKIERAVVCGLSMGGYTALAFWRRHSSLVRALVLA